MNIGQEAREPARTAVGAQREGHRGGDPHPRAVLDAAGPRRAAAAPAPRRRRSRPASGSRIAQIVAGDEEHERVAQRPLRPRPATPARRSAPRRSAPTTPARETRPLALTRVRLVGEQAGYGGRPRDAVRLGRHQARPSACGNSQRRLAADRRRRAPSTRNARKAMVAPMAQRRPWLNRSRNGPISGATIANGSIVRPRNRATWPRASPRRDLEEQRARQRDRHRSVAGGVERVHLDQPGQARACRRPRRWRPGAPGAA